MKSHNLATKVIYALVVALFFTSAISAHAATNLTIDGSQTFQTIDGFGVNANSLSWNNGELAPAIDMLADEMGSTLWRVVFDMEDWEAANDNSDPNVFNWDYYDALYSNSKFQNLWGTLGYLNQKGISSGIMISLMGNVPGWMGGTSINTAYEDEWVEMVASLVYYARNTMHVSFTQFDPLNETDYNGSEGPHADWYQYARLLNKLSQKLDSIGLNDIKLVGQTTASIDKGVVNYMTEMMKDSFLMSKIDHFGFHSYSTSVGSAYQAIKNSAYPNKNFYMTEVSLPGDVLSQVTEGASGITMWDGYDSVYNHAILNGHGSTPPNDAGNGPAPLAYDTTSGTYSPRQCYYQFEQLYKYVPAGSMRIAATQSNGNVVVSAFYHELSGRVTIVGHNSGSGSISYTGTLANLPNMSALQFYWTSYTDSTKNFFRESDIVVSNGTFAFNAPSNSMFTLTGLVNGADLTPPLVSITVPADGATVSNAITISASASDAVGVARVHFLLNGANLGGEIYSPPYNLSWDSKKAANGSYQLTAVARDIGGNTATSSPINIIIANQDTASPTVSISSPYQNDTVAGTEVPINLVQKASTITSSAQNLATTLPSPVTGGNLIVVSVSGWPNLPASTAVTDSRGNTYSIAGNVLISQGAYGAIYYAKNVIGGTNTVTVRTVRSGGQISMVAAEFSGVDTGSPLDKTAGTVGSGNTPSSGNMTPSLSGELVIGSGTHNGNTVTTAGTGFTMIAVPTEDSNTHQPLAMEYQVLNGTPQITATFNLATGYPWTQNGVLFKPAVQQGPDTSPPTVSIISPQNGSTVSGSVTVSASASDNIGITKVEFYLDTALQATITSSPYAWSWNTLQVSNGSHTLTAKAYDAAGNVGQSGVITVTVTAATLVSIAITPSSPSIALGTTQQFVATGTYSDGSTQNLTTTVTWGSSDTTIANISNADGSQGLATPVANGSTTITASSGAISGSTTLTVTASPLYTVTGSVAVLAFEDEFNNSSLDTTKWTVISRHGEYSQSETECNVPGAVSVDANGYLTISTTAQSTICGDFKPDGSVWHTPASWPYSTGDIQWKSMNFTYGTVEIRGRFPSYNTGLWPAFWLLNSGCQETNPLTGESGVGTCPSVGSVPYTEIDMVECYGGSSGWCWFHVANPNFFIGGGCDVAYTVDMNWHVFKTVWAPSSIKQYIDGNLVATCNQSMSNPMFLMIQTQTGGIGGTPNNSYLPANLNVDYVRVDTGLSGPINGSISCTSPVSSGGTSTCTITPNSGYVIGYVSSTCGGSLSENVFTTGAVTSNCTVSTTFITAFNGPDTSPPTVTAFTIPATATSLTVSITSFAATDSVGVTGYLLNEVATTPSPTAGGWSVTAPLTYTFTTPGSKILYAWAKDAAGNVSASRSANIIIDTTPPTVTAFTIPTIASTLTISITSFTAVDNVGVTGYLVNELATAPSPTASGWSATAPISYTFATAGTKTLYAWAKDAAGNVSAGVSDSIIITLIDTTPPTVTAFTVPAIASTLTISITSFNASDNVGVTGYLVNEVATAPSPTASGWSATAPISYTFATAGNKTLYAWAKDAAGNVSAGVSDSIIITLIDTIPPTVTAFTIPAIASTLTISITSFNASDNVGVTGYLVNELATAPSPTASGWSATAPISYTFATAGTKTLYAWAKDAAGNVSAGVSDSIIITLIDTTPPTVTAFTIPAIASTLTISITSFNASDNIGVTGYLVNELATAPSPTAGGWSVTAPLTYTFTTAGNKTLYAWAKDAAGNISSSASASVVVTIVDTIPPTVTAFTVPAIASTLTISITSFNASDNIGVTGYLVNELATAPSPTAGGWSVTAPLTYTFTTAGNKTLYAWAKDAAGNISSSASASVVVTIVDTIPPTVTAFTVPAIASTLTISITSFNASDNIGVTGYLVNELATTPSPTAGGWSATAPISYTFATAGTKTLYAWAKDAAGNVSSSASASVVVTIVDTIPPTVTAFTVPAIASTLTISITSFNASDNVGVTGYLVNELATAPSPTAGGWSVTAPLTYTFTTAGNKTLYAWAKDAAGNVSAGRSANTTIDTILPTTPTNLTAIAIGPTQVNLNWTASTDNVGVAGYRVIRNGSQIATSGITSYSDLAVLAGTTYSYVVRAYDTAGNVSLDSNTASVTTPTVSQAPVFDKSVTTKQASGSRTISSPSLSTAQSNELLVAFIASDGPSTGGTQWITAVTGGGLTWTLRSRANAQAGTAEIWTAPATNVVTNVIVTATRTTGSYQGMMTVAAFQAASLTVNGAVANASASTGAPAVSLVTTQPNSLVWAVGDDWDRAIARTVSANQTKQSEYLSPASDTFWIQYITAPSAAAGVTATVSCSAPTTDRWNFAAIEILPR